MQINHKAIKNILVVRNDRFGEFLLNIPALRALKETFTNARIIAVVDPYVRELAKSISSFIDEIIEWSEERHSLLAKLRLVNLLSKKNINIALMLNPSKEFNIITRLCGIPIRVGYDRKCGFLLTHKMKDEKYLGNKHEIEYNLELVGLIGAKTQDLTLSLNINNDIINNLCKDFGITSYDNLIALHPWTSDPLKQWPRDNFFELAKRIADELGIKVIIVGGKEEEQKSKELFSGLENKIINLTGKTTLKQLAAILKQCRLLISGDSGPVHLASAVNAKVLAIFRNDIPGKSAKRWGPWGEGHIVIEKNNLCDISVDEVFSKVKVMLI